MPQDHRFATSFGSAASAYERGRPSYPVESVGWLTATSHPRSSVLDLGAGTGKLTRALHDGRRKLTAADPDETMLERLSVSLPDVTCVTASAESLPFPDHSFDLVTVAQAWHWFDPYEASPEIARVLRSDGCLGLIWNIRDETEPWVAEMTRIVRPAKAEITLLAGDPTVGMPFGEPERHELRWSRTLAREDILALAKSRSYVINAEPDERERIMAAMADLIDSVPSTEAAHSIELPYITCSFRYCGGTR